MLFLLYAKKKPRQEKTKVVENASLLPVPDRGTLEDRHGTKLYRFGVTQLTLGPGRNLTQQRLGLKLC